MGGLMVKVAGWLED